MDKSNFKLWNSSVTSEEEFNQQLVWHVNHVMDGSNEEDILYEIIIGLGLELTSEISIINLTSKRVFSLQNGTLLICLEKKVTQEVISAVAALSPDKVVFLDEGFQGDDQLKLNAMHSFKHCTYDNNNKAIEFITI